MTAASEIMGVRVSGLARQCHGKMHTDSQDIRGLIFNIMRFAVHDGPGIRTAVFFKGCPLRCAWCHNPESISPQSEIMLRPERCVHCGACVHACPQQGISASAVPLPVQDPARCTRCGACAEACPAEARALIGREASVGEAIAEVLRDRVFYEQSGGGVTFSGGEPTHQPDFLHALLAAAKGEGLHTVVDTCGHAPWVVFKRVAPLVDLFLFDIKIIDPEKHQRHVGVSNDLILENLERLAGNGAALRVRMPLIPGVNDAVEDASRLGQKLAALKRVPEVHLLPYHKSGAEKYARLGRTYGLSAMQAPEAAKVEDIATELRRYVEEVCIGG